MANFTPAGIEYQVKGFSKGMSNLSSLDKAQQGLGKSSGNLAKGLTGLGGKLGTVATVAGGAALAGVGALATGVGVLGVASVRTAISFESAFAGVLKTTDGLTDAMGNLNTAGTELRQGFVDLSKEVPIVFEELAAIGELGGQLGIAKDSLLDFTETVAALGVSTNLSTEEAASGLARLSNIFAVSSEDMGQNIAQLGSTLVDLGNNFATTERDILAFGERLAGAGAIAGLTQADVLGIGTALSSVGVEAEAGGTAVQKVLLAINNAVVGSTTGFVDNSKAIEENVDKLSTLQADLVRLEAQTGLTGEQMLAMREDFIASGGAAEDFGRVLGDKSRQRLFEVAMAVEQTRGQLQLLRDDQGKPIEPEALNKFAQVAGLRADEFKQLWEDDASEAFELFVAGLAREGDNAVNILDDLGLADQRLIRAFLSLSGAGDLLERTIDTANNAFEENTALQDEAKKRYATTESQLLILKNTLRAVGDEIGSRFLPFINRLITAAKGFITRFADPIANAIDEKVIPAIEGIIALGSELFAAFQEGGTGGLVDALGLTPQTVELIAKISQSVQDLGMAIVGFFLPGVEQLATGGLLDMINAAIVFMNQNFEAFKGAIIAVGAVLATAAIASILAGIGAALAALVSPIGIVIALAALLGAAWSQNWFGIQETTQQVISVLQGILNTFVGLFTDLVLPQIQAVFDNLTQVLNNLGLNWGDVWNAIVEATKIVAIGIGIAIGAILVTIGGLINGIATGLAVATSFISDFGEAFKMILEGVATTFAGWVLLFQSIIAGDWAQAWEGLKLIVQGAVQALMGYFDLIITAVDAMISTVLGVLAGFGLGVIEIFQGLSDTLVGNSIIPDMVQQIIDVFMSMVQPILDIFGGLSEKIGGLLSTLFGEGDEGAMSFEIGGLENLASIDQIAQKVKASLLEIGKIITSVLPAQLEMFVETWLLSFEQILLVTNEFNLLLLEIANVTLPLLESQAVTTASTIMSQFKQVNNILRLTDSVLLKIVASFKSVEKSASAAAEAIDKGFEKGKKRIDEVIPALERLDTALQKVKATVVAVVRELNQLSGAGEAVTGGTGIGLKHGIGFQNGLGLGVTIPPGFPNDSFGPLFVESGEQMLVTPRGTSIDEVVFDRLTRRQEPAAIVSPTINVNVGNINNGMDLAMLQNAIEQAIVTGM
jgi:TP901 family phage tail tape measure protein